MAGYLLLPEDEPELLRHLVDERGLRGLATDVLTDGEPELAPDGWTDVVRPLPEPVRALTASRHPTVYVFWWPELGPLRREGDAPEPRSAIDRVARQLRSDASDRWREVLDYERSPIIQYVRTRPHANGALRPGRLQAQATVRRKQPPELLRLFRSIERWLRARCVKVDLWEIAEDRPDPLPPDHTPYPVWLGSAAAEWVRRGGRVRLDAV